MDTALNGMLIVCGSVVLSVLVLFLVRRFADVDWLRKYHEVASYFFLTLGTLYSVLVAFGIFVVWSDYKEAATNLQHEATEVADLSRLSVLLPMPAQRNISNGLMDYLNAVTHDEFPAMIEGRDSQRTWAAVQKLWEAYDSQQLDTPQYQASYAESLKHLTALSDLRRTRLFASRGTVPDNLWVLLIAGGVLLVGFTYFFGHGSVRSQALMTAILAGTLSFSLFLIASLDSPYSGVARVTPAPFALELSHVAARAPK
jgi:hypothetical protein